MAEPEVWCRPIFLSDCTKNCGELLDAARINRITARISVVAPWTSRTMAWICPIPCVPCVPWVYPEIQGHAC